MNSNVMKTPLILGILAFAAIGCGGDIQQLCFIQRPALGGYGIVFTATAAATGTCGATENAYLADTIGDMWMVDKFREDQSLVGLRPGSLLPHGPPNPVDGTFNLLLPTAASLSTGDFASLTPDANNTCTVPTLNSVTGEGVVAAGRTIAPSKLVFLTGSLYQGSQMEVDATYGLNACTRTYHGIGITPIVNCDPSSASACDPIGNPSAGIPASGVNPSFPVECSAAAGALLPFRYTGPGASGAQPLGQPNGEPICFLKGSTFPQLK